MVVLAPGPLCAQGVKPKAAEKRKPVAAKPVVVPTTEEEVVETVMENRTFAGKLPVKPRSPLGSWEQERIKVFRESKDRVVYVTTIAKDYVPTSAYTMDERMVPTGSGSGFVWDKAGHIVTNYHVVQSVVESSPEKLARVEVKLADGKPYGAAIIGYSPANDIAVLHVFAPLTQLKPIVAGRSQDLLVGQSVLAIGNPFGLDHSMSQGIVSAVGRELPTSPSTTVKGVIQTDAAINPGNSGGPLLDSAGRLIGMNTWIAPATGASVGIGFAIPVDILQEVVPKLIAKTGLVDKLYFGFEALPPGAAMEWLGIGKGVVIKGVDEGSPAEKAGLKPWKLDEDKRVVHGEGDLIVGCKGVPLETSFQLYAILERMPYGQPLELDVLREGKLIKITITPERRPVPPPNPVKTPEPVKTEKPKSVEI